MTDINFQRMLRLAEEFFETKHDPLQITVDEETTALLRQIHPSAMSEVKNQDGPIAWVLVIPTTRDLMNQFVAGEIDERELLFRTPLNASYDALYLCSALVLPEFRRKGTAKRLVMKAVSAIRDEHPIKYLFYWEFSADGKALASSIAQEAHLPLLARQP